MQRPYFGEEKITMHWERKYEPRLRKNSKTHKAKEPLQILHFTEIWSINISAHIINTRQQSKSTFKRQHLLCQQAALANHYSHLITDWEIWGTIIEDLATTYNPLQFFTTVGTAQTLAWWSASYCVYSNILLWLWTVSTFRAQIQIKKQKSVFPHIRNRTLSIFHLYAASVV